MMKPLTLLAGFALLLELVGSTPTPSTNGTITEASLKSLLRFTPQSLGEEVPDDFETQIEWKTAGTRLDKIPFFVDCVLFMVPLALSNGWNSVLEPQMVKGQTTLLQVRSSKVQGSPGLQTKSLMWSLRHILAYMYENRRYQEVSFISLASERGPVLGFGQILAGSLNSIPGQITSFNETGVADIVETNTSVATHPSQPTDVTTSRRGLVTDETHPLIYCTDFHKKNNKGLSDYGIYATIMTLIMQATQTASQSPQGLDTPLQGMIPMHNSDADITVAIGSTSLKSETMTLRKAIVAAGDLASSLHKLPPAERWRGVDFSIRDGSGSIVGKGVIVKGNPPIRGLGHVSEV